MRRCYEKGLVCLWRQLDALFNSSTVVDMCLPLPGGWPHRLVSDESHFVPITNG
jgi:hypothetical protein